MFDYQLLSHTHPHYLTVRIVLDSFRNSLGMFCVHCTAYGTSAATILFHENFSLSSNWKSTKTPSQKLYAQFCSSVHFHCASMAVLSNYIIESIARISQINHIKSKVRNLKRKYAFKMFCKIVFQIKVNINVLRT